MASKKSYEHYYEQGCAGLDGLIEFARFEFDSNQLFQLADMAAEAAETAYEEERIARLRARGVTIP